jgi:tetratricopeptide (TPR) repeat protein
LDAGQRAAAAEWLKAIGEASAVSAVAAQEQRRLDALEQRVRALRAELDAVRSQPADAHVRTSCEALLAEMDGSNPPAPSTRGTVSPVREGAEGEASAAAMHRIGLALRTAGRYQRAVECFHRGFAEAPYAKASADLLKEEAWTLRFCLAMMDEADVRLKQLVAIYPHHAAAQWARFYLSVQANLLHPE